MVTAKRLCVVGACFWLLVSPAVAEEIAIPADCQGFDETTGVIRNGSWRAGMPLGGLGCGKFELLPSGWFARFTWNHNWDLPTWDEPFVPSRGTFFALSVHDGPRRVTRWLRRGWSDEELAGAEPVRCVEFRSAFPFATLAFHDEKLPVGVSVRAWSPLVPHNLKDSSLPVAFFEMTLENPTDRPITVSALMSLENYIGIGGVRVREGKQRWYFADGTRAQPSVISGSILQGLRFVTPRRFDGIGRNVAGEYALLSDGPTTDRGWDALGDGKELVEDFSLDGELNGLHVSSREDKARCAGALCRKVVLSPRSRQTVHFVVMWWMPSHVTLDLKEHGHFYLRDFRDAEKLAAYAFDQRERLARETAEWQRPVLDSNLPLWQQRLTLDSVATLVSNSILSRDGEFAMQENPGRAEGAMGAMETRASGSAVLRTLFPELDRRELELFGGCQQPNGEMPRLCGNVYRGWPNPGVSGALTGEAPATRAFISEVQRHARATGDGKFVAAMEPLLQRAQAWLEKSPAPAGDASPDDPRRRYEGIYRYNKSPWNLPALVSLSFTEPPSTEAHRSGSAGWSTLESMTGADLDVANRSLTLRPQLKELHAPVFFAPFWAWLDFGPREFRLKVLKHFGGPLTLAQFGSQPLPQPFVATAGATLDLSAFRSSLPEEKTPAAKRDALRWSRSGIGTLLWSANASIETFAPGDAFDGFRETCWQTVAPARKSDWFKLDLGETRALRRLELLMDTPVNLAIEGSSDGRDWRKLGTLDSDAKRGASWWAADLPSPTVRYLKMTPTADANHPWRLRELRVN